VETIGDCRARLGLIDGVGPELKALYKPPLMKKVADLQVRVLHTTVAVNSFISVLNTTKQQTGTGIGYTHQGNIHKS